MIKYTEHDFSYHSFENANFRFFVNFAAGNWAIYFKSRTSKAFYGKCTLLRWAK